MRGQSGRQPGQIAGLPLETDQPAGLKAVEIDQVHDHGAGLFDHQQIGGLEIAMGRAGGVHPPEQSAQGLGALGGDAQPQVDRPLGDSPAEEVQVLRAADPLRDQETGARSRPAARPAGKQRPRRGNVAREQELGPPPVPHCLGRSKDRGQGLPKRRVGIA